MSTIAQKTRSLFLTFKWVQVSLNTSAPQARRSLHMFAIWKSEEENRPRLHPRILSSCGLPSWDAPSFAYNTNPSAWLLADVFWVGGKTQHAEESGLFFQLSFYPIQGTLKDLFDTVFVIVQLKHIIVCVWQGSQRQQSCLSAEQGICSGFCDPPSWTRVSWVCGCTADRHGWLPKCITRR